MLFLNRSIGGIIKNDLNINTKVYNVLKNKKLHSSKEQTRNNQKNLFEYRTILFLIPTPFYRATQFKENKQMLLPCY